MHYIISKWNNKPFKPSVLFMGHGGTVQNQIRRHKHNLGNSIRHFVITKFKLILPEQLLLASLGLGQPFGHQMASLWFMDTTDSNLK